MRHHQPVTTDVRAPADDPTQDPTQDAGDGEDGAGTADAAGVADPAAGGSPDRDDVVAAGVSAFLLDTQGGRLALIDQWERTAVAFGQPQDDVK